MAITFTCTRCGRTHDSAYADKHREWCSKNIVAVTITTPDIGMNAMLTMTELKQLVA